MENKLEQLLNSLVKAGWKPFNRYYEGMKVEIRTHENYQGLWYDMDVLCEDQYGDKDRITFKPRQVVSKESGLWQFVCENKMINNIDCTWDKFDGNDCPVPNQQHLDKYYEYRLIESSLKDESELEEFLLQNIKVDGE